MFTFTLVLMLVVQYVDGNQKIVHVNELISDDEDYFTSANDEDFFMSASGEDETSDKCCIYGKCLCNSLNNALAHLTSDTMINITTDVTLSFLVKASRLKRVAIIGHNNPTVNCKVTGAINLFRCRNWIIQGIKWNGCGIKSKPALKLSRSFNITIKSCTFQHSKGQVLVLSEMLGDVNISHCNFVHNNHYRHHGAIMHCILAYERPLIMISHCNFTYNKCEQSLVYLKKRKYGGFYHASIIFYYSSFLYNQGASIYVINQYIYLEGKNIFQNNLAESGAVIYASDHSYVRFKENSNITFNNNIGYHGAAIYSTYHSRIHFKKYSNTVFSNNNAHLNGGAITSNQKSHIIFDGNSIALFINNTAKSSGGAIYSKHRCKIFFKKSSFVLFQNNVAEYGGAYMEQDSALLFESNCKVMFTDNTAIQYGAAIYASSDSYVQFTRNSNVTFNNNIGYHSGAGIYSTYNSRIYFQKYSNTVFSNNHAHLKGGAITSNQRSHIIFDDNSKALFINNTAKSSGGAIYSQHRCTVSFKKSSFVLFQNNVAEYGGAYMEQDSVLLFKSNCKVMFTDNTAIQYGAAIYASSDSYVRFAQNSNVTFNSNIGYHSGAGIYSTYNSRIYFQKYSNTVFSNNHAHLNGGAITSNQSSHIIFNDNSKAVFINNTAKSSGGAIYSKHYCTVSLEESSFVLFQNNVAEYGGAILAKDHSDIILNDTSKIKLVDNKASYGAMVHSTINSKIYSDGYSTVSFTDNDGFISDLCNRCLRIQNSDQDEVIIDSNGIVWCSDKKAFICLSANCHCKNLKDVLDDVKNNSLIQFAYRRVLSTSTIKLENLNNASIIGHSGFTVLCVMDIQTVLDLKSCINITIEDITWIGCGTRTPAHVISGQTIHISNSSDIIIQKCTFEHLVAKAVVVYEVSGNIHITNCKFANYTYRDHGVALYLESSYDSAHRTELTIKNCSFSHIGATKSLIYIDGNRNSLKLVYFEIHNSKFYSNQGVSVYLSTHIMLHINEKVSFVNNIAENGAGIYVSNYSTVLFDEKSNVKFINNFVNQYGAAIYCSLNSNVTFTGNAEVMFIDNIVSFNNINVLFGGTIFSGNYGRISFEENSTILFINNTADFGAAILSLNNSVIIYKDRSRVMFNNNTAHSCGALTSALFSRIIYSDSCEVIYNANAVSFTLATNDRSAGAICTLQTVDVLFSGNSVVKFINNTAGGSGAIVLSESSAIMINHSLIIFNNNVNVAKYSSGGAFACYKNSNITVKGNSIVTFDSNKATQNGGAIHLYNTCKIIFEDDCMATFINNVALYGGAVYFNYLSNLFVKGNATVVFDKNKALHGGAICIYDKAGIILEENSITSFYSNLATVGGGAVSVLNNSSITFKNYIAIHFTNNGAQYGAAIYLDKTATMVNISDADNIHFTENIAKVLGSSVFQEAPESCNISCLNETTVGINTKLIVTQPNEVIFYDPAICIDNDNDTQCNSYHVQNIMLGSEIVIPVGVLDHYSQPIDLIQLSVQSEMHPDYYISGPKRILVSCFLFQGISIMGSQSLLTSTNFSMNVSLPFDYSTEWKKISVTLIVELSPCHPGFRQYPNSEKCECYSASDIVFCSGSNSTIKRGYWFGSVMGKPTVTFCPINYCGFTCFETSNGYCYLSPVRVDQCRSHRSGAACGNCSDGHTLSFDSTECVNVESCTAGQKVLVVLLTVIYWIIMVSLHFAMMYYKFGIGYLYSITFYYSIVDILLSQNLQDSKGLYLTVSIMSSFSKITPLFLGELCLTTGMSGIDQQFIHYIHPTAVLLILVIIRLFASFSKRISNFIDRGMIHMGGLFLLFLHASVVYTSLLLIRPLLFYEVDGVFTYLSPDIEYFHDRHLVYGIVALLFIVSITIGLPLFLTLEPFLNHKINFKLVRFLLDQFQGCYKTKYRCFAGYYMICRMVIITIVVVNSSNNLAARFTPVIVCGIINFIHMLVKPYKSEIMNKFDNIILYLITFVSVLPLFDDFDSPVIITLAFVLVILPLLNIIALVLFLHKDDLEERITARFSTNDKPCLRNANCIEMSMMEIGDNVMRENATASKMYVN